MDGIRNKVVEKKAAIPSYKVKKAKKKNWMTTQGAMTSRNDQDISAKQSLQELELAQTGE